MNEDFLAFVWRYQYFESTDLQTDGGEKLKILSVGMPNKDAGPDFSQARIVLSDVVWAGSVELHTHSSDWRAHGHQSDRAYENVVLHVVWENDQPIVRTDGTVVPTLTLKGIVRYAVVERYLTLLNNPGEIPCGQNFGDTSELSKVTMLDRCLASRIDRKSEQVIQLLESNMNDWEETAYQWIGQHFGFKLNDEPFLRLVRSLPLRLIQKQKYSLMHMEALLFGAAGLLPEEPVDVYTQMLKQEFRFMQAKHRLEVPLMGSHEWKFLRLRPAGFPTVRLSQLAHLLFVNGSLFSTLQSLTTVESCHKLFKLKQSPYWITHLQFDKLTCKAVPFMGRDAANLLIINAIVPILAAYARQRKKPAMLDMLYDWMTKLPPEDNRVTRSWEALGMEARSAADSQALLEWHQNFCQRKKCLECAIGASLVRS